MLKFFLLFCFIYINADEQFTRSIDSYKKEIYLEFVNSNYNNVEHLINQALDNYPFHDESKNLRIFQIFNHYLNQEYEKLFADVDIFMTLYRYDQDLYYVFYLKLKSLQKMIEENGIDNSKEKMIDARQLSLTLIENKSQFTDDAKAISLNINKMMVLNEIEIADFYYSMKKYNACMTRLKNLEETYDLSIEMKNLIYQKKNLCKNSK